MAQTSLCRSTVSPRQTIDTIVCQCAEKIIMIRYSVIEKKCATLNLTFEK